MHLKNTKNQFVKRMMSFKLADFNPDSMDIDDLRAWEVYLRDTTTAVKLLFAEDPEKYENNLCVIDLWLYCVCKVRAMECRLKGTIQLATEFERECDQYYKRLPDVAKW